MGDACRYLQSEEWQERLEEINERIFDMRSLIWECDDIRDTESIMKEIIKETDMSRDELGSIDPEVALERTPNSIISWDEKKLNEVKDSMLDIPTQCPHDTYEDLNRCIFHLSKDERKEHGISDEDLRDEFMESISKEEKENKEFIGAKFGDLDLEQEELVSGKNNPIKLIGAEIDGELNLSTAAIKQPFVLSGSEVRKSNFKDSDFDRDCEFWGVKFGGETDFTYANFEKDAEFWNADFHGETSFYASMFHMYAEFRNVRFRKKAQFKYMEVERDLEMWDSVFDKRVSMESVEVDRSAEFRYTYYSGKATFDSFESGGMSEFRNSVFYGDADFKGTYIRGELIFSHAIFDGDVDFEHLHVEKDAHFEGAEFRGESRFYATEFNEYLEFNDSRDGDLGAVFHGKTTFKYSVFDKDVEFWSVLFNADVDFSNTVFNGTTEFHYSEFQADVNFEDATHTCINFIETKSKNAEIKLIDNDIPEGIITQPEDSDTFYNLTESTLGEVELETNKDKNVFDYFRFYETDFDGFSFPEHREALNKSWYIHEFEGEAGEPSPEELESTYLKAKNGADEVGDSKAASEFFIRELKYSRRSHWENMRDSERELKEKLSSFFGWSSNWFYNLTCGYGERPFRTVAFSLAFVALFAVMYMLIGIQGDDVFISYMIFSLQTFVTLIFGAEAPANQSVLVRFLTSFEAFMGAFFIALFVFGLTRSVHR
jgi:uncharacterized protein YjbI with pentapeptide repeats